MADRIAQLYVELSARTDKLEAELKKSQTSLNRFKGGLKDVVEGLTGVDVATLGTVAAVGALAGGIKYAVTQAMEAEQAMAATEAVIKSTGGAAGLTAEQVADMAGELSVATGLADDVVQSGQNMLLTFKNIKGAATFDRATEALADMAVAMNKGSLEGVDLASTAVQLGKALNDPIRGITALTRVGVTFTEEQKELIRSMVEVGNVAGAQAIILAELESEFGGMAEAAGDTAAGSIAKLKNAFSELAEEAGTAALPAIEKVSGGLTTQFRAIGAVHEAFQEGIISQSEYANTLVKLGAVGVFVADDVLADIERKTDAAAQAARDAADNTQDYAFRMAETRTVQVDYNTELSNTALAYQQMGEAANATVPQLDPLIMAQDKLSIGMQTYTRELLFNKAAASLDAEAALTLAGVMGLLDQQSLDMAAGLEEVTRKFDTNKDGVVSATEATHGYYAAVLALRQEIEGLQDKTVRVTTYFDNVYTNVQRYMDEHGQTPGGGGQAAGGPTDMYGMAPRWVGELGPELWVPPVSGGYIVNHAQAMEAVGGGGDTFYIDARGSSMTPAQYEAITRRVLAESGRQADHYRRTGRR